MVGATKWGIMTLPLPPSSQIQPQPQTQPRLPGARDESHACIPFAPEDPVFTNLSSLPCPPVKVMMLLLLMLLQQRKIEHNNCKCILPAMHRRNAVKVVAVVLVRVGVVVVVVEVVVLLVAIGRIRADQNSRRRSAHFEVCYVKKVDALRV